VFACQQVYDELKAAADGRLAVLDGLTGPREAKWAIGQLDWFCGTRMHSTIAALSSGVATAALSYSYKTRGVFATCDVADNVIDPRILDTEQTVEALWTKYLERDNCRTLLQQTVPVARQRAEQQMDEIVAQMGTPVCELRTR
jgi:polysaccharide pyruvyl transferase WcaK-like protein